MACVCPYDGYFYFVYELLLWFFTVYALWKYLSKWNYWTMDMGFKKGIEKCVECEKKMSENPDETGMCSKCGSGARIDSEIQKELNDLGLF